MFNLSIPASKKLRKQVGIDDDDLITAYKKFDKTYLQKISSTNKPRVPPKKSGSGISTKSHGYAVSPDGVFGNLSIDLPALQLYHRLQVKDGKGINILDTKAHPDLVSLLVNKNINNRKTYNDKALKQFKQLVDMSGLPVHQNSGKYKLLHPSTIDADKVIKIFDDPNKLVDRLAVLIGQIESGNDSKVVINELSSIIDVLLNKKVIDKKIHKQITYDYILEQ